MHFVCYIYELAPEQRMCMAYRTGCVSGLILYKEMSVWALRFTATLLKTSIQINIQKLSNF